MIRRTMSVADDGHSKHAGSDDRDDSAGNAHHHKKTFLEDPVRMMPGYSGHVPGIKFMYGISYGEATSRSLANIRRRAKSAPGSRVRSGSTSLTFIPTSPTSPLRLTVATSQTLPTEGIDTVDHAEQANGYHGTNGICSNLRTPIKDSILGYTGYVPGLPFKYGETYGKAAGECKKAMAAAALTSVPNKPRANSILNGDSRRNGTRISISNAGCDNNRLTGRDVKSFYYRLTSLSTGRNPNLRPLRPLRPIVTEEECRRRVVETVRANDAQRRGPRPNRTVLRQSMKCRSRPPSPADIMDPITGYTGHIPHLSYVMGKPYCVAKEECLKEFKRTLYLSSPPSRGLSASTARSTPDIPLSPAYSTTSSEGSSENSISALRLAPNAGGLAKSRV